MTSDEPLTPHRIVLPGNPIALAMSQAHYDHGCVLLDGGEVRCWGEGKTGGVGTRACPPYANVPVVAELPGPATDVAALGGSSCALVEGEAHCWGPVEQDREPPLECGVHGVSTREGGTLTDVARLEVGAAIDGTGAVWMWDDGSRRPRDPPEPGREPLRARRVAGLPGPAFDIANTRLHGYALLGKGELWRWEARSTRPTAELVPTRVLARHIVCELEGRCLMSGVDDYLWGWNADEGLFRGYPGSPTSMALLNGGCMSQDDVTRCWGPILEAVFPKWEEIPGPVEIPLGR